MLGDVKNIFEDGRTLTAGATTTLTSTNIVRTGPIHSSNLYRQLGAAGKLALVTRIDTAFNSTAAGTLAANLLGDNNSGMTSTALVIAHIAATGTASLTKGTRFVTILPPGINYEEYLRGDWTMGTAPMSAGALTTQIIPTDSIDVFYAHAQATGQDNGY